MSAEDLAAFSTVESLLIIGTGLMGTSVALAAKRSGLCRRIVGVDRDLEARTQALNMGALDEISSLESALETSDCIIISVPPEEVLKVLNAAVAHCKEGALIMDLTSVKEPLLEEADRICPLTVHYISVHPMAGRAVSGPESARHDLFDNAPLFLVPSVSTRPEAMERAESFWSTLGARVYQALPSDHDAIVAGTSHLPQLIAYALASTLKEIYPDLQELKQFAGTGLKGMTRTSRSSPELWSQIFQMNHSNLILASSHFRRQLKNIEEALELSKDGKMEPLQTLLNEAQHAGIALGEGSEP